MIGNKWVFRNKENEEGEVVTNKSRIIAQGYLQKEGIDFEESFVVCTGAKIGGYKNPMYLCLLQGLQVVSNGCQ